MTKRDEMKEYLVELNNGNKYLSDTDKVGYFYRLFKSYIKNNKVKRFIYQYLEGDGNELLDKFFNVYSSSRLCFELYSHLAFDNKVDDIEFEYHLPSLLYKGFCLFNKVVKFTAFFKSYISVFC